MPCLTWQIWSARTCLPFQSGARKGWETYRKVQLQTVGISQDFCISGIGLNERQAFDELILIKKQFYMKAKTNSSPWKCLIAVPAMQWAREPIIVSKQGPSHRIVATNYHYANHCNQCKKKKKQAGWIGRIHVYLISKLTMGHLGNSLLQWTENALVS